MTLSKSKILLFFCLAFIVGVWLGKYVNYEIMAIAAMIFIITGTLFWSNKFIRVAAFAGFFLLLGSLRFLSSIDENYLPRFYDQKITVSGIVSEEPDQRSDKTYLTISNLEIKEEFIPGKILLTAPRFPEYNYGDVLQVYGKIIEPRGAEQPGEFSYKNYLSRFGIQAIIYYPQIEILNEGQGNIIKASLIKFKQRLIGNISQVLPEPHNSFLAALLVGLRRGLPKELLEQFNITGTTHIIALSGFNITIIAQFIDGIFQRFGRRISFGIALLAIIAFVIMAGASASVVRAGIMGILGLLVLNIGRVYAITNALVLTAAVMIFLNPKILHFDLSFQLSFVALLGLVFLAPIIESKLTKIPKSINRYLVPTIAAQIFVLPIILYNFDRISLVSVLTNLLVLPTIPIVMGLGWLAAGLAIIWPILSAPAAWLAWVVLSYIMVVVDWTSRIPAASVEIKNIHIAFVIIYYILLAYFLWKQRQKQPYSF